MKPFASFRKTLHFHEAAQTIRRNERRQKQHSPADKTVHETINFNSSIRPFTIAEAEEEEKEEEEEEEEEEREEEGKGSTFLDAHVGDTSYGGSGLKLRPDQL